MTRINTVPPRVLTDAHLLTEIREIGRVPTLALKRLQRGSSIDASDRKYTLGSGHVTFFYDKIQYLWNRTRELHNEADRRGFDKHRMEDDGRWSSIRDGYPHAWKDWNPDGEAIAQNHERLHEKITSSTVKPRWYRETYEKRDYFTQILDTCI